MSVLAICFIIISLTIPLEKTCSRASVKVFLASNDLRFVLYVFLFHPCVTYPWRLTMSHTLDELHQREILEQHYQQGEGLFHLVPLEKLKDPC